MAIGAICELFHFFTLCVVAEGVCGLSEVRLGFAPHLAGEKKNKHSGKGREDLHTGARRGEFYLTK